MIKKVVFVLTIIILATASYAQSPTELIQQIGEQVLVDYTKPLVSSFGAALNSGLYHTAASHKMGGFDLQLKAMYIPIPEDGKTYHYRVPGLTVNPATQQIDTVWFEGDASTVFGAEATTTVFTDLGVGLDTIAIPPVLPKGTGLTFFPFLMPQLSIGIYYGSEILIRYIPTFKIPGLDDEVGFYGIGLKEEINELPVPFLNTLPVNIAVQGVYQHLKVGDIVSSSALNINLEASKTFTVITPYIGVGWEDAKLRFKYSFSYQEPDITNPTQTITRTINIDKTIPSENKIRLVAGVTLNLGPLLLNAAYNLSKYSVISGGLGFSIR
jgi:hypothetical protein